MHPRIRRPVRTLCAVTPARMFDQDASTRCAHCRGAVPMVDLYKHGWGRPGDIAHPTVYRVRVGDHRWVFCDLGCLMAFVEENERQLEEVNGV